MRTVARIPFLKEGRSGEGELKQDGEEREEECDWGEREGERLQERAGCGRAHGHELEVGRDGEHARRRRPFLGELEGDRGDG